MPRENRQADPAKNKVCVHCAKCSFCGTGENMYRNVMLISKSFFIPPNCEVTISYYLE